MQDALLERVHALVRQLERLRHAVDDDGRRALAHPSRVLAAAGDEVRTSARCEPPVAGAGATWAPDERDAIAVNRRPRWDRGRGAATDGPVTGHPFDCMSSPSPNGIAPIHLARRPMFCVC